MDNIIPINRQGSFNLGPGTAPSISTPNPAPVNKYQRPARILVCDACGTAKPIPGEQYCAGCVKDGRDNPWVECREPGCNTVQRRRYKGQQYWVCPQHKENWK